MSGAIRVLHVAAELYPFVKTGGLGDVLAALPAALRTAGTDARLLLPGYPALIEAVDGRPVAPGLRLGLVPGSGVPAYLVDTPALFGRPGNPYLGPDGRDWPDNHRRFARLASAAMELAAGADREWTPDILHGHDWHAGLVPARLVAAGRPARSVFTIHNLGFQGLFPATGFGELGLPPTMLSPAGVEYWGQVSFLKAALVFADRVTTVSPTYAREIATPEQGMGLDGVLRARGDDVVGILNGVDYAVWSPERDALLVAPFSAADPSDKALTRRALQAELGLDPAPDRFLLGAVTRLTEQKGFDLVLAALPALLTDGMQIALLGSGDAALEAGFRDIAVRYPGAAGVRIGYDEALAHRIIGGADALLVPSRFEPCGLTQLYGLRYGSVPIVRRTGGLADTVTDADPVSVARGSATGFVFDRADAEVLTAACRRAAALFREKTAWGMLMATAMTRDFGWARAAEGYNRLYRTLIE